MSLQYKVFLGSLPDGSSVYADASMLAQVGIDLALRELVESHWHRAGLLPRGYKRVNVNLGGETAVVADESRKTIIARIEERMREAMR